MIISSSFGDAVFIMVILSLKLKILLLVMLRIFEESCWLMLGFQKEKPRKILLEKYSSKPNLIRVLIFDFDTIRLVLIKAEFIAKPKKSFTHITKHEPGLGKD